MVKWSLLIGVLGIVVTWVTRAYLTRREVLGQPWQHWLLGLGALALAWLVSLLGLLGQGVDQGPNTPLPPSVLFSSSLALIGVIITDYIVRKLPGIRPGSSPVAYWLLGILAFLPAWAIALWNLS